MMLNPLQLLLVASLFVADPLLGQQQEFVYVPGGTFVMGDHSGTGNADELPLHSVDLDGFWMQTREVRVSHYAYFLNAMGSGVESPDYVDAVRLVGGGREYLIMVQNNQHGYGIWPITVGVWGNYEVRGYRGPHPATWVTFYGAAVYANWLSAQSGYDPVYDQTTWETDYSANGYRLPTEAEWEYAARGGAAVAELYPWGNTLSGDKANYYNSGDPWDNSSFGWTTPVGYYDGNQQPSGSDMANGFGLYDMIGNANELCNDYYSSTYYGVSDPANPTGPASSAGDGRVIRGASFDQGLATNFRTARRDSFDVEAWNGEFGHRWDIGFRLVRNGASFLEVSNFYAGEVAAIQVTGCMPNNVLKIAYSLTGSGPTSSPFGLADLSNPIMLLQTVVADSQGVASMSAPVPMAALGVPVWFQAANIQTGSLSNSLAKIVESNAVPVLFSASPNSSPQGASLTVGVSGIDFVEDSDILIESTGLSVPLSNVDLLSSNYIEGDLNLADPLVAAGVYTIKVVKPSGVYGELTNGFTVTNVAPSLRTCLPVFGLQSTTAQITVSGDFIDQGASIELVQGFNSIAGSSIQIAADGSTITADFALGTGIGFYDVVVTDTDGTFGVLPGEFEVQ